MYYSITSYCPLPSSQNHFHLLKIAYKTVSDIKVFKFFKIYTYMCEEVECVSIKYQNSPDMGERAHRAGAAYENGLSEVSAGN